MSSDFIIDREGLCALVKTLGSVCEDAVEPFVEMLGDFSTEVKLNYSDEQTLVVINSDSLKFVGYDGEGKLVVFNIAPAEMIAGKNNSLAQIVNKAVYYFGIKDFTFFYRSNNITSNNLYKFFGYLPQIPYVIKDSVVICGRFDFSSVSKSMFTKAMTELFGINQMGVYLGAGSSNVSWPAIPTIAADLKYLQSTIRRGIRDLKKAGLLETEQRYRKKGGKSSLLFRLKAE